jgi:multidrug resistance efflux pump
MKKRKSTPPTTVQRHETLKKANMTSTAELDHTTTNNKIAQKDTTPANSSRHGAVTNNSEERAPHYTTDKS